ncbi:MULTISPECIES: ABC transporter ATP-binding protein [Microbacterium]|nr:MULTISPECIES: ABC transporter ATP-binding protein [Microbacterium]
MNDISTDSPTAAAVPLEGGTVPKMQVRGVSKRFVTKRGEVQALAECDLSIAEGEFVTIVGPSGCGKSTLMMIAAGLEDATTGEILVDGKVAGQPGPNRSVVFQKFALFPSQTVFHNIEFGLKVARVPKAERERRVDAQLALMGLKKFRNSYPHELSGGMQQRVAIARAPVVRPEILLMDEPFGALDAQTRTLLQEEVSRLHRHDRYTVLFITHSVEEAVYLADRVIVMSARPGRIKAEIHVPRDAEWRAADIEAAMGYADFSEIRQRIWSLVREEIVTDD